jgi:hypothetical protein
MNTIAIDTYTVINRLKAKGFTEDQAQGIVETITASDYVTNDSVKRMFDDQTHTFKIELKNQHVALMKWITGVLIAQAASIVALQSLIQ